MSRAVEKFKAAYEAGDSAGMWNAMEEAMANDTRRAEAETARRAAALEEFRGRPLPASRHKVVALKTSKGKAYVTGCSFKDGPGFQVSKLSYSSARARAHRFSTMAAVGVAEYLIAAGYAPTVEAAEE